jgi:hypothetical protein
MNNLRSYRLNDNNNSDIHRIQASEKESEKHNVQQKQPTPPPYTNKEKFVENNEGHLCLPSHSSDKNRK